MIRGAYIVRDPWEGLREAAGWVASAASAAVPLALVLIWIEGHSGQDRGLQEAVLLDLSALPPVLAVPEPPPAPPMTAAPAWAPQPVPEETPVAPVAETAPEVEHPSPVLESQVVETAPPPQDAPPAPYAETPSDVVQDSPPLLATPMAELPALSPAVESPPLVMPESPVLAAQVAESAPERTEAPAPPVPDLRPRSRPKPPEPQKAAATDPAPQQTDPAAAGAAETKAAQPAASRQGNASLEAGWGAAIRKKIERRKAYPRAAAGAAGRVTLRITVARDGGLQGVVLTASSGNAALDQAALTAVQRAGRLPAAPQGLDAPSHVFILPMDFTP